MTIQTPLLWKVVNKDYPLTPHYFFAINDNLSKDDIKSIINDVINSHAFKECGMLVIESGSVHGKKKEPSFFKPCEEPSDVDNCETGESDDESKSIKVALQNKSTKTLVAAAMARKMPVFPLQTTTAVRLEWLRVYLEHFSKPSSVTKTMALVARGPFMVLAALADKYKQNKNQAEMTNRQYMEENVKPILSDHRRFKKFSERMNDKRNQEWMYQGYDGPWENITTNDGNHGLLDAMKKPMTTINSSMFIAVSAIHLFHPKSNLLDMLREHGFTVTPETNWRQSQLNLTESEANHPYMSIV